MPVVVLFTYKYSELKVGERNFKGPIYYFWSYNLMKGNFMKIKYYFFFQVVKAASPLLLRIIILGAFFIYSTVRILYS